MNIKSKFFCLLAGLTAFSFVSAQDTKPTYQRSSLHMVLLTTEAEEQVKAPDPEIAPALSEAWKNYPFPNQYNKFSIDFQEVQAGRPKGSMMALLTKYSTEPLPTTLPELKELMELLNGKQFNIDLRNTIDSVAKVKHIARDLFAKWYNIKEDGSYNKDTLAFYAGWALGATNADANSLGQNFNKTIANTYVTFSKLDFYENEPIAAFTKTISMSIASLLPGPAGMAAQLGAEKAYEALKEGYSAYATTLLYKLKWNDSIENAFWTSTEATENTLNYQKFLEFPFELEFVNNDRANSSVMFAKGRSKEELIQTTVIRNLDKQFVKLQKHNEEFRPMVPVLTLVDGGFKADMGTKEGIVGGENFQILHWNGATNTYDVVGKAKVVKGSVWENQYDPSALENKESVQHQGSLLKGKINTKKYGDDLTQYLVKQLIKGGK